MSEVPSDSYVKLKTTILKSPTPQESVDLHTHVQNQTIWS